MSKRAFLLAALALAVGCGPTLPGDPPVDGGCGPDAKPTCASLGCPDAALCRADGTCYCAQQACVPS